MPTKSGFARCDSVIPDGVAKRLQYSDDWFLICDFWVIRQHAIVILASNFPQQVDTCVLFTGSEEPGEYGVCTATGAHDAPPAGHLEKTSSVCARAPLAE